MTIRDYMKQQCIDTDIQNIPENGFTSQRDVREWYEKVPDSQLLKIYEEYYGIEETLLDMKIK